MVRAADSNCGIDSNALGMGCAFQWETVGLVFIVRLRLRSGLREVLGIAGQPVGASSTARLPYFQPTRQLLIIFDAFLTLEPDSKSTYSCRQNFLSMKEKEVHV